MNNRKFGKNVLLLGFVALSYLMGLLFSNKGNCPIKQSILSDHKQKIKTGFIYYLFDKCISAIWYLNAVEWLKFFFKRIAKVLGKARSGEIYATRLATDLFVVLKFSFVIYLFFLGHKSDWLTWLVWYLLITNLYTYFYYQIWQLEALYSDSFDPDRIRRRFLLLLVAIAFSVVGFAYLYAIPYASHFCIQSGEMTTTKAMLYSVANMIAGNFATVQPKDDMGAILTGVQFVFTFAFVAIMLGRSVPQLSYNPKDNAV